MCGIIGRLNSHEPVDRRIFTQMRDSMFHRGPDDCGLYFSEDQLLALGHRRLSLIDLTENGRQPLSNEDKTIWLTVNGEIYNFAELKDQLKKCGHRFSSNTDSEVIIHGYEEWGIEVLNKLKGMFAFALWDQDQQQLFLARDRFGIKPLYYYSDRNTFIFASEIKGIITDKEVPQKIDFTSFCDYFVYRYVPSPKTIWENIYKLPPAHYMLVNKSGKTSINRYWEIPLGNNNIPKEEVVEKVDELLLQSVKGHIVSDVPIGSFLSGGYDSSALVYYMSRLDYPTQTFSIGFENWKDSEHKYAEIVANRFKTRHTSKIVCKEELDLVEKLSYYYDEPIADISIIPTYVVSNTASQHVKAVLSGEGADEIFGGYTWHKTYLDNVKDISFFEKIKNRLGLNDKPFGVEEYSNAMAMGKFDEQALKKLLNDDLSPHIQQNADWFYQKHFRRNLSPVKSFQYLDVNSFMSELVLAKIDRSSMANSLEVRVPYLDHDLVEYMFQIKENVYFKENHKKYVLYENIKNSLPDVILQRSKQGFVGPDSYYQDLNWYKNVLLDGKLLADDIIKRKTVEEWLQAEDHWRLWKILVMEHWYARWC
ncbi:MAG: asparagine synthase (glutamine-hydrolyzing) [Bacteroidota bacterium]